MGPGCFYPGNDVLHGGNSDGIEASMGPGCFYPGNLLHQTGMYQLPMLQWGRDVSIPEICFIKLGCISFQCFNGAGMFLSRKLCRPCTDRKSTRLNSSHLGISYAVFCLKKK